MSGKLVSAQQEHELEIIGLKCFDENTNNSRDNSGWTTFSL